MTRSVAFLVVAALLPLLLDYYTYRNWRRFAERRRKVRWTLPVYRVLMLVMPLTLPVYFTLSDWWEVEPKLFRAVFIGFWMIYYAPKVFIGLGLAIKDIAHFVSWLFGWFQKQLIAAPAAEVAVPEEPEAPAAALDLADIKRVSRRKFVQEIGWSAATVPFVLVGYSVFKSLYDFEVHRVDVPLANLPHALDGLTIGQLSDLHAGSFFSEKPMQEAIAVLHDQRPDLIAVTGDFVNHEASELGLILPALNRLRADLGVYACLGNHDHYARVDEVIAGVRTTPMDLLVNERRTLSVDGANLHILGTDNTGFYQEFADLPRALRGLDPDDEAIRLLLAHTPTFWDTHVRPDHAEVDLMLCGHTHGGQIGFEVGPLRYSLARVAYPRWAGLYTEARATDRGAHHLYVNRGVGTVGTPLRLGIRPEVTLLTLRKA